MTDRNPVLYTTNYVITVTSRLSSLFNCARGADEDGTDHSVQWEDNKTHVGTPQVPNSMGSDLKAAGN